MEGYTTFQLEVIVNPELERDLLAYGCGITVLSPQSLVESIRRHHKASVNPYGVFSDTARTISRKPSGSKLHTKTAIARAASSPPSTPCIFTRA